MRLRDLGLVRVDEGAVADDLFAADDQPVDAMGAGEHDAGHAIVRAASSRPSVRHTAKSADLPGSSEPMSSRRSTAAPPRVPSRIASRPSSR